MKVTGQQGNTCILVVLLLKMLFIIIFNILSSEISWISVHPPCWQAALNAQNLSMFYSSRSSWKSHCCSLLERERHAETVRNFVRTWRPSPAPASIFLNSWFAKFLVIFIPASLIPTWGFKQDLLQIIERNLAFTCWAVTPWVGGPLWAC